MGYNSCKSGNQTSTSSEKKQESAAIVTPIGDSTSEAKAINMQSENWTREQAQAGPDSFRLVVSFISVGAGTDPEAKAYLDKYIIDYKGNKNKMVSYIMIPWGREGEVDCCFNLKELTATEQEDFIQGLRKTMIGRELIQVNENAKNRFKH